MFSSIKTKCLSCWGEIAKRPGEKTTFDAISKKKKKKEFCALISVLHLNELKWTESLQKSLQANREAAKCCWYLGGSLAGQGCCRAG